MEQHSTAFLKLGAVEPSVSHTPIDKRVVASKKTRELLRVVKQLNESRLGGNVISLCRMFSEATTMSETDNKTEQLADCWETLSVIFGESEDADNVFMAGRQNVAASYLAPKDSVMSVEWHRRLLGGARKALERMYMHIIDRMIAQYPRDSMMGGRPSAIEKIRAYTGLVLKRMPPHESDRIEMLNGIAIWAVLFYLIRVGCWKEALLFAQQYEITIQRSEPCFVAYLKAFLEAEDNM